MEIFSGLSQSQRAGILGAEIALVCSSPLGVAHACGLGHWRAESCWILGYKHQKLMHLPKDVGSIPDNRHAACTPKAAASFSLTHGNNPFHR